MKYLSIIIPSYNMEAYLAKAIESITTCAHLHEIEVLVVNDGSKDGTSQIGHHYADLHPGNVFVIDKHNGNYGSCINEGLKVATGKYVKILDADDYLHTAHLDQVVEELAHTDADMLVTPFCKVDADGHTQFQRRITLSPHADYQMDTIKNTKAILGIWMHEIAYRRQMLIDMGYQQTVGISYTDMEWGFVPLLCVKTVRYIPTVLYYYLTGREGQTVDPLVHRKKYYEEIMVTRSMLQALCKKEEYHTTPAVCHLLTLKIRGRLKIIYRQVLVVYQDFDNQELLELTNWMKDHHPILFASLMKMKLSKPLFPFPFIQWWYTGNRHMLSRLIFIYKKCRRQ